MTSLENLTVFYNSTEQDSMYRSVLRVMLCNIRKVGEMNIYELSELCYTSPSTVSRLVRRMGYKSYTHFQSEISSCVSRYAHHNRFIPAVDMFTGDPLDKMLSSLEELYRDFRASLDRGELDIIAAAMHDARRVVIFPYGVMLSENYLQSDLFMSGIPCDIIIGDKAQLEAAKSLEIGELALVLSPDCIDAVAPLKNLTSVIKSKMARLCTISGMPGKMQNDNADIAITLNGRQSILDTYIMELYLAALDMRYRSLYLDKMQ